MILTRPLCSLSPVEIDRVGHLTFTLVGVGNDGQLPDSPARIKLTFGEVLNDVAESFEPYTSVHPSCIFSFRELAWPCRLQSGRSAEADTCACSLVAHPQRRAIKSMAPRGDHHNRLPSPGGPRAETLEVSPVSAHLHARRRRTAAPN